MQRERVQRYNSLGELTLWQYRYVQICSRTLHRNRFTGTSALTNISTVACSEVKRRLESIHYKH